MDISERSLADVTTRLIESPRSVLICDTCALLDIIRIPIRIDATSNVSDTLNAAIEVLEAASSGRIILILPPPVHDEWLRNIQNVSLEIDRHILKIDKQISVALEIARIADKETANIQIAPLNLRGYLTLLCERIMDNSIFLREDTDAKDRAATRALSKIPPGAKGAIGDCVLYEHALKIAKELRNQSFGSSIVLLTSNTKDFHNENNSPKPPIDQELGKLNMVMATTWNWAWHIISSE